MASFSTFTLFFAPLLDLRYIDRSSLTDFGVTDHDDKNKGVTMTTKIQERRLGGYGYGLGEFDDHDNNCFFIVHPSRVKERGEGRRGGEL